jgi:hypothetical protein
MGRPKQGMEAFCTVNVLVFGIGARCFSDNTAAPIRMQDRHTVLVQVLLGKDN